MQTHHWSIKNFLFLSSTLPIPTLSSVLCQKPSLGPQNTYATFFISMIFFLQPSQDKHCIDCSSLRHTAKLHFINSDYSTKPFSNPLFTTFISSSRSLTAQWQLLLLISSFSLKIGTTTLRAHSTGIPNPSSTL